MTSLITRPITRSSLREIVVFSSLNFHLSFLPHLIDNKAFTPLLWPTGPYGQTTQPEYLLEAGPDSSVGSRKWLWPFDSVAEYSSTLFLYFCDCPSPASLLLKCAGLAFGIEELEAIKASLLYKEVRNHWVFEYEDCYILVVCKNIVLSLPRDILVKKSPTKHIREISSWVSSDLKNLFLRKKRDAWYSFSCNYIA